MAKKLQQPRRLSQWEINAHLPLVKGWRHEGPKLVRALKFRSFPKAIKFVSRLARPAERLEHHPDIEVCQNEVKLELTTHDVGGLSELDIEMAKAINKIKV